MEAAGCREPRVATARSVWYRGSEEGSNCEDDDVERREADDMVRARTLDDDDDEFERGKVDETPVVELRRERGAVWRLGEAEEVSESDEAGRPAAIEVEEKERERRPNSSYTELILGREDLRWGSARRSWSDIV